MTKSKAETLADLPQAQRVALLSTYTAAELTAMWESWEFWARSNQLPPPEPWTYWLVMAGRGFGKTRVGTETVRRWVKDFAIVNLIGATVDDARDIMIEGESGILAKCPPAERPEYVKSARKLVWPNGATSLIFTADEPERLRGKQHMKLWCDELGAWRYPESWDQAQLGLRLGNNPQAVVTTTPRPVEMVKSLLSHPACITTRGTTYDNRRNLAPAFYDTIIRKYEGTRLGRQELMAELLTDVPGALWTHKIIDAGRISLMDVRWDCVIRIVVAIDPAVTSNPDSDETGIVVGALTRSMHVLILDDVSCQETPLGWARAAILAYRRHKADRIVAEVNNGGDLVEGNIRGVDASVPYRAVRASRGKAIRAEPVAALYEQGRVHHVGSFPELEQQLCEWTPIGDAKSPDRLDALCWCVFDLLLDTEEIVMQTPLVAPYRIL